MSFPAYCEVISILQEIVMSWLAEEIKQVEGEMSKEYSGISRRLRAKSSVNRLLLIIVAILTLMILNSCDKPCCAQANKGTLKNFCEKSED